MNCKSVATSSQFRGLIAIESIKAGTKLRCKSSQSRALVQPVLFGDLRNSRCAYCFGEGVIPPSSSKMIHRYCSTICEAKDVLGRMENSVFAQLSDVPDPDPTVILAHRLAISIHMRGDIEAEVVKMVGNTPSSSASKVGERLLEMINIFRGNPIYIQTIQFPRKTDKCWDLSAATLLLSKISQNAVTMTDEEMNQLGIGIFPTLSTTNHSCEPNALQSFTIGCNNSIPSLNLYASRNIASMEEVFISYCDVGVPTLERKTNLLETYKFTCDCLRCSNQDSIEASTYTEFRELEKEKLRALDAKDFQTALTCSRKLLAPTQRIYGIDSIHYGIASLTRAKLELLMIENPTSETMKLIVDAKEIFVRLYGENCDLVKQIRDNYCL